MILLGTKLTIDDRIKLSLWHFTELIGKHVILIITM